MKKVIGGKIFNTETAETIASADNGYYFNDFNYCSETLYLSRKGQYFLAGEGGPMSHYAERVGDNSFGGGEGMRLLTKKEALEWCQDHNIDADTIEAHFEDMVEEG